MAAAVRLIASTLAIAAALGSTGCGRGGEEGKSAEAAPKRAGPPATLITVAKATRRSIEVTEEAVGTLENVIDPRVGAEVAGKVVRVLASQGQAVKQGELLAEIDPVEFQIQSRTDDAEIARLTSLVGQQERLVERQEKLVGQGFISQNALDDAIAQRNALREQLAAARSRADSTRNVLRKTRVVAPVTGRVQDQIVAAGDFVKVGDPLFLIIGTQSLVAHLPFPETALQRIRVGMPVRITSPLSPEHVVNARVDDIRPAVTAASRALDVIVKFSTDERMRGGGTVNAAIVTAVKPDVLMVPESSVILRPAGQVVYIMNEGRVQQRVVKTGTRKEGLVEIVSGLEGGETVAADGAGFLTDGAAVALPKPAAGKAGKAQKTANEASEKAAGKP